MSGRMWTALQDQIYLCGGDIHCDGVASTLNCLFFFCCTFCAHLYDFPNTEMNIRRCLSLTSYCSWWWVWRPADTRLHCVYSHLSITRQSPQQFSLAFHTVRLQPLRAVCIFNTVKQNQVWIYMAEAPVQCYRPTAPLSHLRPGVCIEGHYILLRFFLFFERRPLLLPYGTQPNFNTCPEVSHIWKWSSNFEGLQACWVSADRRHSVTDADKTMPQWSQRLLAHDKCLL